MASVGVSVTVSVTVSVSVSVSMSVRTSMSVSPHECECERKRARDREHERERETQGAKESMVLQPIYVDKLTAGTLPSKHFRLVKEAERASKNKNGRMSERQRSELLAALKKLPPIEPTTRRPAGDKDKDNKFLARNRQPCQKAWKSIRSGSRRRRSRRELSAAPRADSRNAQYGCPSA